MKYVSLIVACFLILGSFSSIGFANKSAIRVSYNQDFGQLQQTLKTVNQNTFTLLEFDEAQQKIHIPGNPMLPMYTKLITIPFGSTIKEIQVETNSVAKMSLSHKILPAPYPVTDSTPEKNNMYRVDSSLYSSDSYFPTEWIKYFNGAGIDKQGNRINYLTIQYYPVQYNPVKNNIRYVDEIDVSIILDSQENPVSYPEFLTLI